MGPVRPVVYGMDAGVTGTGNSPGYARKAARCQLNKEIPSNSFLRRAEIDTNIDMTLMTTRGTERRLRRADGPRGHSGRYLGFRKERANP
jgi:hypothetical protein